MLSKRFAEILNAVISVALSYIFSLANCDFPMKLMVPGNGVLVEGGGKIEADRFDFEVALYLISAPEDQGGDMLAESSAEDSG